ncbi:MAG: DUF1573 domain-containing protein [Alistipes sp.]|nr:DUF1573 domain-containing protein [Alistipes sp.]MDE5907055.1 DUF1573 domain-containing protein [Alistipes sp.]
MASKKHIVLIITLLCSAFAAQAQLSFEAPAWDFGSIRESDGRVSHTFTGVNRGSVPVVIVDVVTSCGCTIPEFSRKPVLPGDSARITVTYDPMNRPGAFSRELGVYTSERKKAASLTIRGSVVPREKSLEELYPVDAGGGLRLDGTLCAFTYVYQGGQRQMSLGYVNASDKVLRLELRPEHVSGLLSVDYPRQIGPGAQGEINFRYAIPAGTPRYGTLRDALAVRVDGRDSGTVLVAHAIGADNPASVDKSVAPQARPSALIVKFGSVKRSAPLQRRSFTFSNTGAGDLIVRAVENQGRVAVTLKPGDRIAPGGERTVELLLDPARQEYGVLTDQLLLITNDPARPMRRLRITAIIED